MMRRKSIRLFDVSHDLMSRTWSRRFKMIEQNAPPSFFRTAIVSSLHISFVSRPWSFSWSAPTALPCEPPLLYRGQWMEEEKNDGRAEKQLPVTNPITSSGSRERREINLFPITWEILFVPHKEILFDNQNKSSSTALLCSDLVVLQPFQAGN